MICCRVLLATSLIFLFSCGGSGGGSSSSINNVGGSVSNNAPDMINNYIFEMTIDNLPSEGLGAGFPIIENKLIHHYGDYEYFYLQSDQYSAWEYQGEFNYQLNGNDNADVDISVESTGRAYKIHYQFSNENSGTWQGEFNDGNLVLNGTFKSNKVPEYQNFQFVGNIENQQEISSTVTNTTYQYQVYLPPSYGENDKDYPVIYSTDGQWEFWKIAYLIETSMKNIILVAITQGPADRRLIDYALPGSHDYLDFLAQEMLPLMESQYRIDINNRAIAGFSWGGLLVRHALINEVNNPLFKNFISGDGSYWHEDSVYQTMEKSNYSPNSLMDRQLYLSGATRNGNDSVVSSFNETILSYGDLGLTVFYQSFEVEHVQSPLYSVKDALIKLFPNE